MTTTDARFAEAIPALYDEYLGPLLFEPYAADIAARLAGIERGAVLETAAGTGVVTRVLARSLPSAVRIVVTDLSEAMLSVAKRRVTRPSLTWAQADAQRLPFGDAEFDAVVCQFGVMFLPDRPSGYREARRVLTREGRFVFNVWDTLESNEVSLVVARSVAAAFPADPPRLFERTPFGYNDPTAIRQALVEAGFGRVSIESVEKVSQVRSAHHAAVGLCQGTPLRTEIESRAPGRLAEITAIASDAIAARFGAAPFESRMRALVVTALPA